MSNFFADSGLRERPRQAFARCYGLDASALEAVLREALRHGGDFADIYVEARRATSLQLEENLLKESSENVSLGAGVRVVAGEQTGYAYTNDLSRESLAAAARVAAQIASGPARVERIDLRPASLPARYVIEQPATRA
ncbi:MAG: PmbA/TldA family metallopeptidase, partial [Terriglobia bacterium]